MPKHIIEFNLPEEQEELDTTLNASKYYICLWDMQEYFRTQVKYENLTEEEIKVFEKIREKFYEVLNENGIEL